MKTSFQSLLIASCLSAATTIAWAQNPFVTDFNSGVPAGSTVTGSAVVDASGGIGNSGVLKLTVNAPGLVGGYVIDDFNGGTPVTHFKAVARVAIGGGTARPADGMSFSFGSDVSSGAGGEDGEGTGIIVAVDTWDNAVPDTAPAMELKYGGAVLAFQSMAGIREGGRPPDGPLLTDALGQPVSIETLGPAPAAPTDSSFVNLVVELFPDNTVSVGWSNVVVFNRLPIPYTPVSGGRWAISARTGGATDDHWIDNLAIYANHTATPVTLVIQPSDQTVTEGQRATFSTAVAGTPPYRVQWFRNNVAIPGATELFYTTPPSLLANHGDLYRAEIRNAESPAPVVTRNARLNVVGTVFVLSAKVDVCNDHTILVRFNKPVALIGNYNLTQSGGQLVNGVSYGADHSQVLVDTEPLTPDTLFTLEVSGERGEDGSAQVPDPISVPFSFGFGRFCADFEDGMLPAGTTSTGTTPPAVGPGAGGAGQVLHITDRVNSQQNHWSIPLPNTLTLDRFQAKWKTYLEGLGGADGFSFNVGFDGDSPPFTYIGGVEEEGADNGLSVSVDTFNNGGDEVGPEIKWNGARLAFTPAGPGNVNGPAELMKGEFVDTSVEVTPSGLVTFKYDNFSVSAQIPGFTGLTVNRYEFGARTGGANENFWIDDLCINAFSLTPPVNLTGPNDLTVIAGETATFSVTVGDGIPPFSYQWLRGGAPIAGATGSSYSFAVAAADQGAEFSVVVGNDCGSVTSRVARLTIINAPVVLGCSSRGNCHAIYLTYSKPVLLNGTYSAVCSNTIPAAGVQFFAEDFNAGNGGFTVDTPVPYDGPWIYDAGSGSWTQAGQGPESNHPNTSTLISPAVTVSQVGVVQLTFAHRYSFEPDAGTVGWDGGQVRVSVNGGPFTAVPASAFTQNGYSGTVRANSTSALHGEAAFVNNSPNFAGGTITSTCMLGSYAASDSIRVAFIAASDGNTQGQFQPNWQIDSLQLTVAGPAVSPITITGVTYGEASNVVCLAVSPDLIPDTRAYYVTARDVQAPDGVAIFPNPTVCSFVHGTVPPVLTCTNLIAECAGGLTPVTYTVTAVDLCGGPVANIVCVPPSGSGFQLGTSNVTCAATASSGHMSTCTFTVTVVDTTPPAVNASVLLPVQMNNVCGQEVTIVPANSSGVMVQYIGSCFDACGIGSFNCTPPSGSIFPLGSTTVVCACVDRSGNSNACVFTITVRSPNDPPVCVARLLPEACGLAFTDVTNRYVITLNGSNACVILDGSASSDPDNDPLQFAWAVDGTNLVAGAVVTNCFDLGCHSVDLWVSDGQASSRCATNVCVITACEAVEQCILLVDGTNLERKNKRPLITTLKAACASFDRGNFISGMNQLEAFQNKVRAQVARSNPAEALAFIGCTQRIIEAIVCGAEAGLSGIE